MKALIRKMDGWLLRHGFWEPQTRSLVRVHCLASAGCCLAGLLLGLLAPSIIWFGIGAALAGWNFYSLSSVIRLFSPARKTPKQTSVYAFKFLFRLVILGLILAGLLRYFKVSVVALLAGLSITIAVILFWHGYRLCERKPKEA